jgi:hypothetical protein
MLSYQNTIVISDLSDRVDSLINGSQRNGQYPPKDFEEIEKILRTFRDEYVKPGEKINDMSSISFSTFSSNKLIASIDIGKFKDINTKQQFVNSKGGYRNCGLDNEIKKFMAEVRKTYREIRNPGLDLISILSDKIENKFDIKQNVLEINGADSVCYNYDNHIYIFTDGYLEYQGKKINDQYYFGVNEIARIREYCKINDVDVDTALKINSSLGLPKITNEKNCLITLHIMETHKRDWNTEKLTYEKTGTLRDNDILKAVWKKWANESKFKDLTWATY